MLSLVYGQDALLVPWICQKLDIRNPGPCVTIGVARDGKIIGCALFNNLHLDTSNRPFSIEISFATIDKAWANRAIIYGILAYSFSQLRVRRLQATISRKNRETRSFLEHLGFRFEGTGRQAWPAGGDAFVFSMLSGEWARSKWNLDKEQCHRKISSVTSRSARSQCDFGRTNAEQQGNGSIQLRA